MINYPKTINYGGADVSKPIPGEKQVKNNAGGYVYEISPLKQVQRFCIIGSCGGTYYVNETKHTEDNVKNIINFIKGNNGQDVFDIAHDVIDRALSSKVDHSLFVIALCVKYGDTKLRKQVYNKLNSICKTASHLFMFVNYVKSMRGIGRGLKNSIANWYLSKEKKDVLYQILKYQNRAGLDHRKMILCSHPKTNDVFFNNLFFSILNIKNVSKDYNKNKILDFIYYYNAENNMNDFTFYPFVKNLSKVENKDIVEAIKKYGLVRENIPTKFLNDKDVWLALLENMPYIALIRNLGRLSSKKLDILNLFGPYYKKICEKITNENKIKHSKIHPIQLFIALETYKSGGGYRGNLNWEVNDEVVVALEKALEISFVNVKEIDKNICFALDVSGSMSATIDNTFINATDMGKLLAYMYSKSNERTKYFAFDTVCKQVNVGRKSYSDFKNAYGHFGGGTDLGTSVYKVLEMVKNGQNVDALVIVTDNETWVGKHPIKILEEIRKYNPEFKLVTLSTTATQFCTFPSNENDRNILDVIGFSPDCISIVNHFIEGKF